ncbi:MAG: iron-containing alcohol dehydrogenase, partial [Thermoguttaceae bacterium]
VMLTFGGGSIKKNGVYDQVVSALKNHKVIEFGGIEPNPRYETLMKGVDIAKKENVGFLLAVGGGSVLDGTKFMAAAIKYSGADPWDILEKGAIIDDAVMLGSVITLPATGSEMNAFAVISRESTKQKLAFASPKVFPQFAIIDPETNFSLSPRQVTNGIVDTFVHVSEQYMTYPDNAPLQDRQAEAIYSVLLEEGPKTIELPNDYNVRANICWAATWALNGWINCGVSQDWTTHMIGHEITAFTGADHAQTLALILPAVWQHQRKNKGDKLVQIGERVYGINEPNRDKMIDAVIAKTKEFFRSVGMNATKANYGLTDDIAREIVARFESRGSKLGERGCISYKEVAEIFELCD